jgi:hypothetical protein
LHVERNTDMSNKTTMLNTCFCLRWFVRGHRNVRGEFGDKLDWGRFRLVCVLFKVFEIGPNAFAFSPTQMFTLVSECMNYSSVVCAFGLSRAFLLDGCRHVGTADGDTLRSRYFEAYIVCAFSCSHACHIRYLRWAQFDS